MTAPFKAPISPAPIASAAEAEQLVAGFIDLMDRLVAVVKQETELVRLGRLAQAAEIGQVKTELSGRYLADALRLQTSQGTLARILPDRLTELRRRHDAFRVLLQINLTVLATAHAVSEGIVRGVSGEMTRKAMPQAYGSSGKPATPPRNAAAPLAVSRVL